MKACVQLDICDLRLTGQETRQRLQRRSVLLSSQKSSLLFLTYIAILLVSKRPAFALVFPVISCLFHHSFPVRPLSDIHLSLHPDLDHLTFIAPNYAIWYDMPPACIGCGATCAGRWNICTRRFPIEGSSSVPSLAILTSLFAFQGLRRPRVR
jgi:hypothetical protein